MARKAKQQTETAVATEEKVEKTEAVADEEKTEQVDPELQAKVEARQEELKEAAEKCNRALKAAGKCFEVLSLKGSAARMFKEAERATAAGERLAKRAMRAATKEKREAEKVERAEARKEKKKAKIAKLQEQLEKLLAEREAEKEEAATE